MLSPQINLFQRPFVNAANSGRMLPRNNVNLAAIESMGLLAATPSPKWRNAMSTPSEIETEKRDRVGIAHSINLRRRLFSCGSNCVKCGQFLIYNERYWNLEFQESLCEAPLQQIVVSVEFFLNFSLPF